LLTLAALCAPLAGCSSLPWHKVPLDAASGFYQSASLTYRLDAGQLQQPLDVVKIEGQAISYEQVASSPLPDQTIGTLALVYPHPAGRSGMAQATFTLTSTTSKAAKPSTASSWNPFKKSNEPTAPAGLTSSQPEVHETWTLDLPSAESDQIFKALSSQNFFNTERPAAKGIQLTVKMNGTEVQKDWEQVPELNALVQRVRRQGQLVAYSRPMGQGGLGSSPISSTQAYNDLVAKGEQRGGSPPAAAIPSAFSLAPQAGGPINVAERPSMVR
jgi:hypothetical protein